MLNSLYSCPFTFYYSENGSSLAGGMEALLELANGGPAGVGMVVQENVNTAAQMLAEENRETVGNMLVEENSDPPGGVVEENSGIGGASKEIDVVAQALAIEGIDESIMVNFLT